VAICLENRLDYCCYWLGLSMIGVVPALINHNLRQQSLRHTITIVKSKAVIFSKETEQAVAEITQEESEDSDLQLYCSDTASQLTDAVCLAQVLPSQSTEVITEKLSCYNDPMVYVYTSGTTGLPKAATVKHSRYLIVPARCHESFESLPGSCLPCTLCMKAWHCQSLMCSTPLCPCITLLVVLWSQEQPWPRDFRQLQGRNSPPASSGKIVLNIMSR